MTRQLSIQTFLAAYYSCNNLSVHNGCPQKICFSLSLENLRELWHFLEREDKTTVDTFKENSRMTHIFALKREYPGFVMCAEKNSDDEKQKIQALAPGFVEKYGTIRMSDYNDSDLYCFCVILCELLTHTYFASNKIYADNMDVSDFVAVLISILQTSKIKNTKSDGDDGDESEMEKFNDKIIDIMSRPNVGRIFRDEKNIEFLREHFDKYMANMLAENSFLAEHSPLAHCMKVYRRFLEYNFQGLFS